MPDVLGATFSRTIIAIAAVLLLNNLRVVANSVSTSTTTSTWCPDGRYPSQNGDCLLCYDYCHRSGCTGASPFVGPGGCRNCWKGLEINSTHIKCIIPYLEGCAEGYYLKQIPTHQSLPLSGSEVCLRCHELCSSCLGPGVSYCVKCKYYKLYNICVRHCPSGTQADQQNRRCIDPSNNRRQTLIRYLYNSKLNTTTSPSSTAAALSSSTPQQ
ncbi:epidermal growth factor receptor-like [Octopus sinensis]|uniref:Epidermal growth factor receptor-like n=1 Tax=Octopus sinensis TaxID=2607531 RepID=A0A7E6FAA1_9MOLL|nr:epidermal growth factor receptor-like [Octopus sinensis]